MSPCNLMYKYLQNIDDDFIKDIEINDVIHCLKIARGIVIIWRPGTQQSYQLNICLFPLSERFDSWNPLAFMHELVVRARLSSTTGLCSLRLISTVAFFVRTYTHVKL
jgi:hypothetical protein